ncbi:unnamed protein product [Adineta steineri]|uniref:ADP ribosyltransferase domain-containing protein n=1 Tax=Adineta steineri TaxID=433720 RepID=A0A819YKE4_9BILA|nr:unnamed protein product [Adineta steineri]CAF4157222.1 unnamed protein product [Adineta steineri]
MMHQNHNSSVSIVWLNLTTNETNSDISNTINQLRHVAGSFKIFNDANECIDFITNVTDQEVSLIICNSQSETFISIIEDIPQLHSIYIFDYQQPQGQVWSHRYKKLRGVFTQPDTIIDALKQNISNQLNDLAPFSIVSNTSSSDLDQLDQSFMYTQLLKETILDTEYDDNAKKTFTDFCLTRLVENDLRLEPLHQFEKDYDNHSSIWWYTKESFVYSILNKALRTQDTEMMIKMAFFLRDLHEEIKYKHSQISHTTNITVYRGQGMNIVDVEKLRSNKGGLFSFNSFLSTSTDEQVSLMFADSARENPDLTGVLFRMTINPSISSTPYVSLNDIGQFNDEEEILFSMHTIFRIGEMTEIDDRLWEVNLTLTSDNDPQLKCLTDYIRQEMISVPGWFRMGFLMQKMGEYEKALEIFTMSLQIKFDDDFDADEFLRTLINVRIGDMHELMGTYTNALDQFDKALEYFQIVLPSDNSVFAVIFSGIAKVYWSTGNYVMSLSYFEKALEIWDKSLPPTHPNLALNYNNIGIIHQSMGNHVTALSYFEKALEIMKKSLPLTHPNLALNHNNIALQIMEKSLPSNHHSLALNYNNIAAVHQSMGNHVTALTYSEKALQIMEKSHPPNHPNYAAYYICIGETHRSLGNYTTAYSYFQKALLIQKKSLPHDHPDVAKTLTCISLVNQLTGNDALGYSNFVKALEIQQKYITDNHEILTSSSYNTKAMLECTKYGIEAMSQMKSASELSQRLFSTDHLSTVSVDNSIDEAENLIKTYSNGLSNLENMLQIAQYSPSMNQKWFYGKIISSIEQNELNQNILSALSCMKKVMKTDQNLFSCEQPVTTCFDQNNSDTILYKNDYIMALSYYAKALQIVQRSLPPNNPYLATNYNNFGNQLCLIEEYQEALSYFEKALEIIYRSFSNNHSLLAKTFSNMANALAGIGRYKEAVDSSKRAVETAHCSFEINNSEVEEYEN